jgi:hypothetical protein
MAINATTEQLSAAADALAFEPATDDERKLATAAVRRIAARHRPDHGEDNRETRELLMLAALDLVDPYTPIPGLDDAVTHLTARRHVKRSGATTHGTAAGYGWHAEQRVPLCSKCKTWAKDNPADGEA